jgi:hypothetical protein
MKRADRLDFGAIRWRASMVFLVLTALGPAGLWADESHGPEATLRLIVEANAARDLQTLSEYMSHDADAVGYTVDGHKYVGWPLLEAEMRAEFLAVHKLELPITYLRVWQKGDVAWFAMELDYIRYFSPEDPSQRMVLPLRETGVLERRDNRWILVAWHESGRQPDTGLGHALRTPATLNDRPDAFRADRFDVSGEWDVTEVEDNKRYRATLDAHGQGSYTWQGGQITTTRWEDRHWHGTWKQSENDREGAFELVLSEDGTEAKGIWWYTRVGTKGNIPPRQHGGTYEWKRQRPSSTVSQ